jgi:membrane-associated protease RseP (regulator of RpoE activity)
MRNPAIALAVFAMAFLAIGGAVALRAWSGDGSSSALAASAGQSDIFSSVVANQQTTDAEDTPWLGARVVATSDGLTVSAVIADSPADKAGLEHGDVITAVDGVQVDNMKALLSAIKDKAPGDSLTLSILRNGESQDVTATLEARPEPLARAHPLLPELNDIPRDELFGHMLGGSFQFTDKDGNAHTAGIDLGTVSAVDADGGTITVDLNAGGSETYTIGDDVLTRPQNLSSFESGDRVTIISVDDSLRAIVKGGGMLPFFGPGRGGPGGHQGGEGPMMAEPGGEGGFEAPERNGEGGVENSGRMGASGL